MTINKASCEVCFIFTIFCLFNVRVYKYRNEYLNREAEFRKEYDALEVEYQVINAILNVRTSKHITQEELSKITGIAQGDISKIEKGNANPSLRTIQRIASGMGMTVKIEFVEK